VKTETLAWLACPACGSELSSVKADLSERESGLLECENRHRWPVVKGIPRFTGEERTATLEADSIQRSFGSEWDAYDYGGDRVWGQELATRREIALRELDCAPEDLEGRIVLDAGCGTGMLSSLLAEMGARVIAADISLSVDAARSHFPPEVLDRVEFIQADMTRPPFRPDGFDIVFSGGVLHHNADTRTALGAIAPLAAPRGQIYAWLYGPTPGLAHRMRAVVRKIVVPLPARAQRAIFCVWTAQSIGRQTLRRWTGRARPSDGVTYREKLVILLDHYTPRYRWEHTPDELAGWFRELGFSETKLTEVGEYGFGVLARRDAVGAERVPETVAAPA
jgi:SAM-dependent methyltransferase